MPRAPLAGSRPGWPALGAGLAGALAAGCSSPPSAAEYARVHGDTRTVKATLVAAEPCPEEEPGAGCARPRSPTRAARVLRPRAGNTITLDAGAPAWLVSAWVGARRAQPKAVPPPGQPPGVRFVAVRARPAAGDGRRWRIRLPRRPGTRVTLLHVFVAYRDGVGLPFAPPRLTEEVDDELRWARWEVRMRLDPPRRRGQRSDRKRPDRKRSG